MKKIKHFQRVQRRKPTRAERALSRKRAVVLAAIATLNGRLAAKGFSRGEHLKWLGPGGL